MLKGIAASPGIAIGSVVLVKSSALKPTLKKISKNQIEKEITALKIALQASQNQLQNLQRGLASEIGHKHSYIFDAHLLILKDPNLADKTIEKIEQDRVNAAWAVYQVSEELQRDFEQISDPYLKERGQDVKDVVNRILLNMGEYTTNLPTDINGQVILVAAELSPSETAQMDKSRIIGFATDVGGSFSHTTILARSLGIPAVVGLNKITQHVKTGDFIILDGTEGIVIVDPSEKQLLLYQEKHKDYEFQALELQRSSNLPAETLDGHRVHLAANIEFPEELEAVKKHQVEGIGLYRTEFLYLNKPDLPSEEEHYQVYRYLAEAVAPYPTVIRTLDLGGDKLWSHPGLIKEANPVLGLRAIRLSLAEKGLFRTQLRAILRASAHGNIRILYPMISGLKELQTANQMLQTTKEELSAEGKDFDPDLLVGVMIEVPSAALIADLLARECDFFSIGSNDLIQYCLATDRTNENVAYLYEPLHPAMLRIIQQVVSAAAGEGIRVMMCGEMAADPMNIPVLLGLGIEEFSMNPAVIPLVKRVIRSMSHREATLIAEKALQLRTAEETRDFLINEMMKKFPHGIYGFSLLGADVV